jgi:pSer/pThr/pTyr-binding forkhead associated (FHA) protein
MYTEIEMADRQRERSVTYQIDIMVMSGVDDGMVHRYASDNGDGKQENGGWTLSVGRRDDNDLCLRYDTYSSRYHARLHLREERWWLEDCDSRNGTFVEDAEEDARVIGTIPLEGGQLFRVGRTWLRLQEGG